MRKAYIWSVRLNREYTYSARILTSTANIAEAMTYAMKHAHELGKIEGKELIVSTLECEGEILVPDGILDLTEEVQ